MDRKTQEALAEIDGFKWYEPINHGTHISGERHLVRKYLWDSDYWRPADMTLPVNDQMYRDLPNYDDEGEMHRMLERWKEAAPKWSLRRVGIDMVTDEVRVELIQAGQDTKPTIGCVAPTFIEAASEALKKAGER